MQSIKMFSSFPKKPAKLLYTGCQARALRWIILLVSPRQGSGQVSLSVFNKDKRESTLFCCANSSNGNRTPIPQNAGMIRRINTDNLSVKICRIPCLPAGRRVIRVLLYFIFFIIKFSNLPISKLYSHPNYCNIICLFS